MLAHFSSALQLLTSGGKPVDPAPQGTVTNTLTIKVKPTENEKEEVWRPVVALDTVKSIIKQSGDIQTFQTLPRCARDLIRSSSILAAATHAVTSVVAWTVIPYGA